MNLSLGPAFLPHHPHSLSETILLQGWSPCKDTKRACSVASVVSDSATPWTVAHQAPLSMGFSRQEYWSGLPFPFPWDLPNLGIEPGSPALQVNSLPRATREAHCKDTSTLLLKRGHHPKAAECPRRSQSGAPEAPPRTQTRWEEDVTQSRPALRQHRPFSRDTAGSGGLWVLRAGIPGGKAWEHQIFRLPGLYLKSPPDQVPAWGLGLCINFLAPRWSWCTLQLSMGKGVLA